ncbi:NAD-dependent epimerase/dehydratase family protein [Actinomycetospora sp. NBRC 106378]|uniref:NAD-dependent epimerase/dehydratase family protein n=1 Tax=Actinomycetospora sp. NBRC 106378 TaxID=3032208 RepID=UPI0024A5CC11|nr:NAD-dependent epimerase/dehydratase family protein [Actinomycetospora sp. NBRC 106378]GLZ53404.1 dTDP-glucose 4,6-dehydratase [Actinomycetospora sp. NBRC 106378]
MTARRSAVLLAGATGVLGRRIAPLLVGRGHRVVALVRDVRAPHHGEVVRDLEGLGVEIVEGDVLDAEVVASAVAAAAPEVLMHQLTDLRTGDSASNAVLRRRATAVLASAARAAGTPRVIAQSISWAYAPLDRPATEDTPLDVDAVELGRRRTVGAIAELEAAISVAPTAIALRYGVLYGPGTWFAADGDRAADAFARRLVADDAVTSFVHVDDAARAAVDALDWPSGPVNICDDEPVAARSWVPLYCAALGAPTPPEADRTDRAGPRRPTGHGADNGRARRLGWDPLYPSWRTTHLASPSSSAAPPAGHAPDPTVQRRR